MGAMDESSGKGRRPALTSACAHNQSTVNPSVNPLGQWNGELTMLAWLLWIWQLLKFTIPLLMRTPPPCRHALAFLRLIHGGYPRSRPVELS